MIYFLQGEITRRIKIGFTAQFIRSRMGALQTGSPDRLIFLGAHPGDEKMESMLHGKFREFHSHGEWFHESPSLIQYIGSYCIRDIKLAHSADSLVSGGVATYESLLKLDRKELHDRFIAHLVDKLG